MRWKNFINWFEKKKKIEADYILLDVVQNGDCFNFEAAAVNIDGLLQLIYFYNHFSQDIYKTWHFVFLNL